MKEYTKRAKKKNSAITLMFRLPVSYFSRRLLCLCFVLKDIKLIKDPNVFPNNFALRSHP